MRTSWLTPITILLRSELLKPGDSTRTEYVPGLRLGAAYAPAESVTKSRVKPRCVSVMVTFAPATEAPLESMTVPARLPAAPCENSGTAARSNKKHTPRTTRYPFTHAPKRRDPNMGSLLISHSRTIGLQT